MRADLAVGALALAPELIARDSRILSRFLHAAPPVRDPRFPPKARVYSYAES